jgi:hypothetical protein
VIPEFAGAYSILMEIVDGEAAERLREAGGIGAWLGAARKPVQRLEVTPLPVSRRKRRK